jgi:hypothetical protein
VSPPPEAEGRLDRREFLRRSALTGGALTALAGFGPLAGAVSADEGEPRVRRRVRLGRTGLELPDIGFGTSSLAGDASAVQHALARGITHFDTAETYTDGAAEETLGRALAGSRNRVTLASKTQCYLRTGAKRLMEGLEQSLQRLQTDHIDLYFNHAVNSVDRLQSEGWLEFTARAKQQGKIRFTGMSGHGGRLVECIDYAVEHDLVDVLLVAFNFGQDPAFYERLTRGLDLVALQPGLPAALEKAKQKGVGVIAMKTLRGARLNDLRPYESGGASFAQAAFRWVLSHSSVDALVVTMKSPAMIDEYLGASGWTRPHRADLPLLERYEGLFGRTECRYGCQLCASACPEGVPIAEVLRSGMYARGYGDLDLARREYAQLGGGASACLSCSAAPCAGACPFGLEISALTRQAHALVAKR